MLQLNLFLLSHVTAKVPQQLLKLQRCEIKGFKKKKRETEKGYPEFHSETAQELNSLHLTMRISHELVTQLVCFGTKKLLFGVSMSSSPNTTHA